MTNVKASDLVVGDVIERNGGQAMIDYASTAPGCTAPDLVVLGILDLDRAGSREIVEVEPDATYWRVAPVMALAAIHRAVMRDEARDAARIEALFEDAERTGDYGRSDEVAADLREASQVRLGTLGEAVERFLVASAPNR